MGGGPPLAAGDVLDGLTRLLDRSLVQLEADAGGTRGTPGARRPATACWRRSGSTPGSSSKPAGRRPRSARATPTHYLALEEGQPDRLRRPRASTGPEPASRARLVRELDNVRAALRWCLEHGAAERALAFAVGPLWSVWFLGGHWVEARRWLDELLAAGEDLPAWLRAAGHFGAGACAQYMGDYGEARARLETSVALSRQAGEAPTQALAALGRARWLDGDDRGAEAALREGLAGAEAAGDGLRRRVRPARPEPRRPRRRATTPRRGPSSSGAWRWRGRTSRATPCQYLRSVARLGQLAALEGRLPEAAARLREALAGMAQDRGRRLHPGRPGVARAGPERARAPGAPPPASWAPPPRAAA